MNAIRFGFIGFVAILSLTFASSSNAQPLHGGGRPSYDRLLTAFDSDEDGALSSDEVPARVWARLSQADADDDGVVTRDEFESY